MFRQAGSFTANSKTTVSGYFTDGGYARVVHGDPCRVSKVEGSAVKDELGQDGRWRMILENLAHGLDLGDSVHKFRDEPAPDLNSGRA